MIKIYKGDIEISEVLNRKLNSYDEYEKSVKEILKNVAEKGDKAVKQYTEKFDGISLDSFVVSAEEFDEAEKNLDDDFKAVLQKSIDNITAFHVKQLKSGFELKQENGVILGQKYTPIEKVGIYVPGGTASYPSTVLMNGIPAKIAGVGELVMTTPVQKNGKIKPEILYAAKTIGVDKVYKLGGAQAIAALAYGTESVGKVDKIVGPGNIFVALAKKQVFGTVGIDMVAGPSEILVIADGSANPVFVSADLLSQAEHDKLATAVLITDSEKLAYAVQAEIEKQLDELPRSEIARASVNANGKIIVADGIEKGIEIANEIAPEHLEISVDDPFKYLDKIKNAGSIFLGKNTPEALGDYYAGPNHTLPTSGSAKFSSPLSVDDFVKKSSYIYYTREALCGAADDIDKFAKREGLDAHAKSVTVRFK